MAPDQRRIRSPDREAIADAARALQQGNLVVFPTETVYGLGAHALDPVAVARIFAAKGRPADNPLIVHVADEAAARALAKVWPADAQALAAAFWPGPLTLVVPRAEGVPLVATAGLETVALRVPAHPVARGLLEACRLPIAAPSANRSGAPSPTRVQDAFSDLGDSVDVYLDGGPTPLGIESTVVGVFEAKPVLLRPGALPRERIEAVVGSLARPDEHGIARSPGMRHRHYAPRARLHLERPGRGPAQVRALEAQGLRVALVAAREHAMEGPHVRVPGAAADADAWARSLYSLLRDLDRAGYDAIVVEEISSSGLGEAILDRLRRAAEG